MKLYMKQHIFTWGDRFSVYDDSGSIIYTVEGEVFSFGNKLHIYNRNGEEVAFVHQELLSFLPRYSINQGGYEIAQVEKEFTFFRQEYRVDDFGWIVSGDFFDHDYSIYEDGHTVASVYREWFTLGDAYALDIDSDVDPIHALAVALVIDAVISDIRHH